MSSLDSMTSQERKDLPKRRNPLYKVWYNMTYRCAGNDKRVSEWYYDRGIEVCDRWTSYELFLDDMNDSWSKGLWLDRINPDEGYSPENCRWASPSLQQINRKVRKTNPTNHKGIFRRSENGKYRTGIMIEDQWVWLGTFESLSDAIGVRTKAQEDYYVDIR